jgi:hypothetical protein
VLALSRFNGLDAGLKVQEEGMHELARMAEARQEEARQQVDALLAERSQLLEAAGEAAEVRVTRSPILVPRVFFLTIQPSTREAIWVVTHPFRVVGFVLNQKTSTKEAI